MWDSVREKERRHIEEVIRSLCLALTLNNIMTASKSLLIPGIYYYLNHIVIIYLPLVGVFVFSLL